MQRSSVFRQVGNQLKFVWIEHAHPTGRTRSHRVAPPDALPILSGRRYPQQLTRVALFQSLEGFDPVTEHKVIIIERNNITAFG